MGETSRWKAEANFLDPAFKAGLDKLIDDLCGKPELG